MCRSICASSIKARHIKARAVKVCAIVLTGLSLVAPLSAHHVKQAKTSSLTITTSSPKARQLYE